MLLRTLFSISIVVFNSRVIRLQTPAPCGINIFISKLGTNDIYKRDNSNEKTRGFEINPLLLSILHKKKFIGDEEDPDPYEHIACFKDICGTFQLTGYTADEVRVKLFCQTLTSIALSWII